MKIDSMDYQGNLAVLDGVMLLNFPQRLGFDEIRTLMDAAEVESDQGVRYEVGEFRSVRLDSSGTDMRFTIADEAEQLRTQLVSRSEELREKQERIERIWRAIAAMGTGLPSLTKLREFLIAVKEAVDYADD